MKIWALYLSTPRHGVNGISLHATREDAIEHAIAYLEADDSFDTGDELRDIKDEDERYDAVDEAINEAGDEWYLTQTALPAGVAKEVE